MPNHLAVRPFVLCCFFLFCVLSQLIAAQDNTPATTNKALPKPHMSSTTNAAVTEASATTEKAPQPGAIRPGRMVDVESFDQSILHAYFVEPQGPGPFPAIILLHDIYGLTPWHKKEADLYASWGYVVVAPNLYSRDAQLVEGTADARLAWVAYNNMPDSQALKDIRAFVGWLGEQSSVMDKPIGVVGYSMGGIYTLGLASIDLRIKAAVNFYGRLEYHETTTNRPASPVDALFNLTAPLLSFYGESDPGSPLKHIAKLERRLSENPNKAFYQVIKYPSVGHNFMNDQHQGYSADSRADALQKAQVFLDRHLKNAKLKKED